MGLPEGGLAYGSEDYVVKLGIADELDVATWICDEEGKTNEVVDEVRD